jgi:hypothetical protein
MAKGKGMKPAPSKSSIGDRPNGKAKKKNPKTARKTGRTIGGYKPEKIRLRELKRQQPHVPNQLTVDAMNDAVEGKTFKTLD